MFVNLVKVRAVHGDDHPMQLDSLIAGRNLQVAEVPALEELTKLLFILRLILFNNRLLNNKINTESMIIFK
jgi:hypothetical protein